MVITNIKVYTGTEMTAQDFAMLIEKISPVTNGVLYGCEVSIKNSNTIHVSSGWCVLHGRIVRVEEGDLSVELPSSGSITRYLVLVVDLANSSNPAEITVATSIGTDTKNFNVISGQAYLSLGKLTIGSSSVSSVTDAPTVVSGSSSEYVNYTISSSNWSGSTTSVDGANYYTYTISLNRIMDSVPIITIGASGTVPTQSEKTAYSQVYATVLNTSAKTLTLYAKSKPTTNFIITVKGVN